jgi:hypothetical protein
MSVTNMNTDSELTMPGAVRVAIFEGVKQQDGDDSTWGQIESGRSEELLAAWHQINKEVRGLLVFLLPRRTLSMSLHPVLDASDLDFYLFNREARMDEVWG